MPLDPSIFFQGAALRQASNAKLSDTITNAFDRLSKHKLEQDKLDAAKAADYEGAAMRVLMNSASGLPSDPADLARARAFDAMQQTKMAINPATGEAFPSHRSIFGNLAQESPVSYKPVYGTMEQMGFADEVQPEVKAITMPDGSNGAPALPKNNLPTYAAQPSLPVPQNTLQAKEAYQAKLDMSKEEFKQNLTASLDAAKAETASGKANAKVGLVLGRMSEINEELKKRGAIVSKDLSIGGRATAYALSTKAGQEGRTVLSPQDQALVEEYKSLQSTLLPYYAAASGLTAKSLDSEGERKSILDSFGNPAGIYEANAEQLTTLNKLFNVSPSDASSPQQQQSDIPQGAKLIGTSKGKKVYQLPDGTHAMEK